MANDGYTVATASQLIGAKPPKRVEADELYRQGVQAMDHANRERSNLKRRDAVKRSAVSKPSSIDASMDGEAGTDIFTHSRHASWECSPNVKIPDSVPRVLPSLSSNSGSSNPMETNFVENAPNKDLSISQVDPDPPVTLLQPIAYSPPRRRKTIERSQSPVSKAPAPAVNDTDRAADIAKQKHHKDIADTLATLSIVTDADASHKRNSSNSSTSSRRGRHVDAIYFTPIDMGSKVFLSSAINCTDDAHSPVADVSDKGDADLPTPRAVRTRPPSQIYVGPASTQTCPASRPKTKEGFHIKQSQLEQLVTALVRSRLVQKDVRKHWWDSEDIPDDDSLTSVSVPTLTSASTLYSQPNQRFEPRVTLDRQSALPVKCGSKGPMAEEDVPFGGVALTDPKIHGSPIRFISKDYRSGPNILSVGSCSFLTVPYGTDVECTLRIDSSSPSASGSRILLQCANQVVDRTTGKRAYLLVAEVDVTEHFTHAAVAELAAFIDTTPSGIDVCDSPNTPSSTNSMEVDWVALADELQYSADIADTIDATISSFSALDRSTAAPETLSLLAAMDGIKDQHSDFLLLRPTAHHDNGAPATIQIPWVSQRLYRDWYEAAVGPGLRDAAKQFQADVVAEVGRKAGVEGKWEAEISWGGEGVVVQVVPLWEGGEEGGRVGVWVCFVRGVVGDQ